MCYKLATLLSFTNPPFFSQLFKNHTLSQSFIHGASVGQSHLVRRLPLYPGGFPWLRKEA